MQKRYTCKYCGKTFDSVQALYGHLGRVHSQRGKRIEKLKEIIEEYLVENRGVEYKKYAPYLLEEYLAIRKLERERLKETLEESEDEEDLEEETEDEEEEGEYEETEDGEVEDEELEEEE